MLSVDKLLAIPDSKLSWLLRMSLHGLESQLKVALRDADADPGKLICEELLEDLGHILNADYEEFADEDSP